MAAGDATGPAGARLGSDPGALEAVAVQFESAARFLRAGPLARPSPAAHAMERWTGRDAGALLARLGEVTSACRRVAVELEGRADVLRRAARTQRQASSGGRSVRVRVDLPAGGGRIVQRVGPMAAPIVVVIVPGVGTDPADRERLADTATRMWDHMAGHVDRSDDVAVVSWLGYDPPDVVPGALDVRAADDGAAALVGEVRSLRAGGAERVIVVGHSYGGVVAGRALLAGMDADAVVYMGAPGLGAPGVLEAAAERGVELRAVRAPADPIGVVAGAAPGLYGPDGVGAVPSLPHTGRGHSAYLSDAVLLDAVAGLAVGPGSPTGRGTGYRRRP